MAISSVHWRRWILEATGFRKTPQGIQISRRALSGSDWQTADTVPRLLDEHNRPPLQGAFRLFEDCAQAIDKEAGSCRDGVDEFPLL
jgi:hypothetical protein